MLKSEGKDHVLSHLGLGMNALSYTPSDYASNALETGEKGPSQRADRGTETRR